jgi:dTDP-4-amino-4,6-dideoxygalactose transaminase
VAGRDLVMNGLHQRGIDCAVHYPVPIHLQPAFRGLGYQRGAFPVAERCADELLSLPVCPELSRQQVREVAAAVIEMVAAGVLA